MSKNRHEQEQTGAGTDTFVPNDLSAGDALRTVRQSLLSHKTLSPFEDTSSREQDERMPDVEAYDHGCSSSSIHLLPS